MSDRKMGHVQSLGTYLGVFGALVVLTVVTYAVSFVDLGSGLANELVAMGIAAVKASLVTLFFMHAKYEGKVTWAFVIYPGVLLFILLGGLFLDYGSRRAPGDTKFILSKVPIAKSHDASHDEPHGEENHDEADHGEKGADAHGAEADHGDEGTETPAGDKSPGDEGAADQGGDDHNPDDHDH